MKSIRKIQLLFYLLRRRKTTAVQLAEEFGVSLRTIYRDLDALSQAGIPLYTTTGRNGGVSLMEEFILDRTFFTQQEQNDLITALKSLTATGFVETQAFLEKLSSLRKFEDADPLWVNFSHWGADQTKEVASFKQLKQAILQKNVIMINYLNRKGEEGWRAIEPLKLVFQENQWYLFGFCRSKGGLRLFRLSRMLDFEVLAESFERIASIEVFFSQAVQAYGEQRAVELLTDPSVKHRLLDTFGAAAIQTVGGQVQVETQLPLDEWLVSYCLSLGPALKEVQPAVLREKVAAAHQQAYRQLRSETDG